MLGKGFKMKLRDFCVVLFVCLFEVFLVRFCLITTVVEWLAKVRNLLFPLSEQRNKASERTAQTNAVSFFSAS